MMSKYLSDWKERMKNELESVEGTQDKKTPQK